MRLFFAATIPKEIIARIAEAQQSVRQVAGDFGIKWTRPEQFHYTVKFLGEQPPARARTAVECALVAKTEITPFDVSLGGFGAFPNDGRPSVLWIGATEGSERLAELAGRLDALMLTEGFRRENRPFNTHLTIARIKGYAGEVNAVKALRTVKVGDLGRFTIDRFVLMQSTLKPTGSEYAVVEEFKLNG